MKQIKSLDLERKIYELSIEDILTVIKEDELNLELDEKDIKYIEERVGVFIDWRSAISSALFDLENSRKLNTSN